jgi:hypothetical protein
MEMVRCNSRNDARYSQIFGVLRRHIRVELAKSRMDLAVTTSKLTADSDANIAHELSAQLRPAAERTDRMGLPEM